MKKMSRLVACLLVVSTMVTMIPLSAFAGTINCGGNGSAWERTYSIYHMWGVAVKLARYTSGKVENVLGTTVAAHGTYSYTVQDPDGDVIKTGTWKADSKSSVTLVGALAAKGTYTITISKVKINTTTHPGYTSWDVYPKYKFTF